MNRVNYQKELDKILDRLQTEGKRPTLFLHACCAPCSSYCLEYLTQYFDITVYYYNPNITDEEEYRHRVSELERLAKEFPGVKVVEGPYDTESFFEIADGLENVPEGGERCMKCFRLRLSRAVQEAAAGDYDYVTTTLSISPMKNAAALNEIGKEEAQRAGACWLPSDFKKKGGYQRSIELSAQYGLYRQDYCGCCYSKAESERRRAARAGESEERDG